MTSITDIHVLVLPSWYPPRGGTFFRDHSMALAAEGLKVNVLAAIQTSLNKHGFPDYLTGRSFSRDNQYPDISPGFFAETRSLYRNIPFLNKASILGWIRHTQRMAGKWIDNHGKPDIIQVHSSIWAGVAAARIRQQYGIPYVITEHRGRFVYQNPVARAQFQSWHFPLIREAFSYASGIVTVSDALHMTIREILSGSGANQHQKEMAETPANKTLPPLLTIPNLVDTRFFNPALKQAPTEPFTFFSLAHLEKLKGIDTLIDAMLLLKEKNTGCRLLIGGDGPQRKQLEAQVNRLGLQQQISFAGKLTREEVKTYMHQAHAFILPSRFEAFGLVLIEAMACGLPVIATRSGGPESIVNPACGMLVNPDQANELASAMEKMISIYDTYDRNAIWMNTINQYSPKAIAKKYIRLYEQIIGKNSYNSKQ